MDITTLDAESGKAVAFLFGHAFAWAVEHEPTHAEEYAAWFAVENYQAVMAGDDVAGHPVQFEQWQSKAGEAV